jgi:hypothetical protein
MVGTLVDIKEDENARFRFEIWFDYTRQGINLVHEGAMLAVPNFASSQREQRLSILEVVTILPMHYGLGSDTRGYPGFVVEAARSAANDWEEQEAEATEDTTKIKCAAIPTNFEIVQSARGTPAEPQIEEESNIPMLGSTVRLLDTAFTQFVINRGRTTENTCAAGVLIRDEQVSVLVRVQDLLRTHFGIFGFTGAGKSNLVSTLIHGILSNSREPIKIVIFDLMGEYSTLLIDHLVVMEDALVIALGEQTLPESVIARMTLPANLTREEQQDALRRAVIDMVNTSLLPPALSGLRERFNRPTAMLLTRSKVRIYREATRTIDGYVRDKRPEVMKGNLGGSRQVLNTFLSQLEADFQGQNFTVQTVSNIMGRINQILGQNLTKTATNNLTEFRDTVQRDGTIFAQQRPLPPDLAITIPALIARLNDRERSGLYVIQAHDPDDLRHFAAVLGNLTYEDRRKSGQIVPLVSFVFDEADEFIPQQASGTYGESTQIAMTLARRGRKFGLGIGIATQRVIYLNTSIMAQPHTYLVSKMPRQSDRDRISEAFGASEDVFRQTFKFKKGDWLLMSYDATGLEAIPIPIHTDDANVRIRRFLDQMQQHTQARRAEAMGVSGVSSD